MSKLLAVVSVCAVGALVGACAAPAEEEQATQTEDALKGEDNDALAAVRRATAKYHDVNVALADGYVADPVCAASPAGAMGVHYINPALVQQPPDPNRPGILLYEPTADGPRLVGVEWFMPVIGVTGPSFDTSTPPIPPYNPAPVFFGHTFDGPMPGHNPAMPWHYDLHAWLWKHNPNGTFSEWNPNVHCP